MKGVLKEFYAVVKKWDIDIESIEWESLIEDINVFAKKFEKDAFLYEFACRVSCKEFADSLQFCTDKEKRLGNVDVIFQLLYGLIGIAPNAKDFDSWEAACAVARGIAKLSDFGFRVAMATLDFLQKKSLNEYDEEVKGAA